MKQLNSINFRLLILLYLSLCINFRYLTSLFLHREIQLFIVNTFWHNRSLVLFCGTIIPLLILSIVGIVWTRKIGTANWNNFDRWSKVLFVIWSMYNGLLPFLVCCIFVTFWTAISYSAIYLLTSWPVISILQPTKE